MYRKIKVFNIIQESDFRLSYVHFYFLMTQFLLFKL